MIRSRVVVAGAVLFVAALGGAGAVGGSVAGQSLEEVAERFALAWADDDEAALAELLTDDGVRLHLDGEGYAGVRVSRVLAALEAYRSARTGGSVEVDHVALSEDAEPRAYADLVWVGHDGVTGEAFRVTIFLGLVRSGTEWFVDEIRAVSPG